MEQNNYSNIKIKDTKGELMLDAELLRDKEISKWIDIEAEIESITQSLDDSFVGQMLDKFRDAIGNPDYEFDTEIEAETFALSILNLSAVLSIPPAKVSNILRLAFGSASRTSR